MPRCNLLDESLTSLNGIEMTLRPIHQFELATIEEGDKPAAQQGDDRELSELAISCAQRSRACLSRPRASDHTSLARRERCPD
jgi:hypothetical protein